ncbi:hypothetical protein [Anaeromyxobacter sp. Fw109-5]|uniref:hypothetical protein n=1 Tax=Anaeromyxobacter sp. (strain Fw109-5) TaxID=404589 RepID=UPI000158A758|nr:hypothetical protein [Anaeromyxobacter sp. Fw109-5]ABS26353.1 hypothetical protein Anae109_2151 [Anaeromyxobacter sp. Fw109-5]
MTRLPALGILVVVLALGCSEAAPAAASPSTSPAPGAGPSGPAAPSSAGADPVPVPVVAPTPGADVQALPPADAPAQEREAGRLADPGSAPSAATLVREAVALEPTGPIPLARDEETVVDPAASFRVELRGEVPDGRLVLLDAADAIVPSSGMREVGATTRFTLAPAAPLVPGARYVLRLDGARARELQDVAGRTFGPLNLTVLVAGEPPKPEPKPAPKRKRRR